MPNLHKKDRCAIPSVERRARLTEAQSRSVYEIRDDLGLGATKLSSTKKDCAAVFKKEKGYILILVLSVLGFLTLLLLLFSKTFLLQKKLEDSLNAQTLAREYAKVGFQAALNLLQTAAGPDACLTCTGGLLPLQPSITYTWTAVIKSTKPNTPLYLASIDTTQPLTNQTNLSTISIPLTLTSAQHQSPITLHKILFEKGYFAFHIQDLGLLPVSKTPLLGIPVNTITGGLKTNLFLDKTLKGSLYNSIESPNWEYLYSFLSLVENNKGSPLKPIPSIDTYYPSAFHNQQHLATPLSASIGPIIQGCQIGISLQQSDKRATQGFSFIKVGLSIEVALWNPYDVALETSPYAFEITTLDHQADILLNNQSIRLPQKDKALFKGHFQAAFKPGEIKTFKVTSGPLDLLNGNELLENPITPSGFAFFEPPQYFAKTKDAFLERKLLFRLSLHLSPPQSISTDFFQEIRDIKSTNTTKSHFNWDTASLDQPIFLITFLPSNKNYNLRAPLIEGTYTYNHGSTTETTDHWLANWHTHPQPLTANNYSKPPYHLPTTAELSSLASLRWANFTFLGDEPSFPLANSQLPLHILSSTTVQHNARKGNHFKGHSSAIYDHSYLLNNALWDNVYFLKTTPPSTSTLIPSFIPSFNVNNTFHSPWINLLESVPLLTPQEKQGLADAIVQEVKKRGPFRSLSQFINRQLSANNANDNGSSYGTLAAAIQKSHLEQKITQPELLELIGNQLTVRSDTFRIIAFGECPLSLSSKLTHKIWCEAILQRQFDLVDPSNKSAANQSLGRRFKIKRFSWVLDK